MVHKNKLFINFQFPVGENPSCLLEKLFNDFQDVCPYDLLSATEMKSSFFSDMSFVSAHQKSPFHMTILSPVSEHNNYDLGLFSYLTATTQELAEFLTHLKYCF